MSWVNQFVTSLQVISHQLLFFILGRFDEAAGGGAGFGDVEEGAEFLVVDPVTLDRRGFIMVAERFFQPLPDLADRDRSGAAEVENLIPAVLFDQVEKIAGNGIGGDIAVAGLLVDPEGDVVEEIVDRVLLQAGTEDTAEAEDQPPGKMMPDNVLTQKFMEPVVAERGDVDLGVFPVLFRMGMVGVNIDAGNIDIAGELKILKRAEQCFQRIVKITDRIFVGQVFFGITGGIDEKIAALPLESIVIAQFDRFPVKLPGLALPDEGRTDKALSSHNKNFHSLTVPVS